jgi:hypothetical protein
MLHVIVLNGIILNVIMLNVIMQSIRMLNVIMLCDTTLSGYLLTTTIPSQRQISASRAKPGPSFQL